jgi:type IV pilus assembly protein PilA
MLSKLRERSGSESGFTLVELLVVMLILGILAAIAIPAFFNQRDKARDADTKASVRTVETAEETYFVDNGEYTGTLADLTAIEPTINDAPSTPTLSAGTRTYTVGIQSDTGTTFTLERQADGSLVYNCDAPGTGGCPTGGNWGQ